MTMTDPKYGTTAYYKTYFEDILADVATGDRQRDEETIVKVLTGFEQAMIAWMEYYEDSQRQFRELHGRFMRGDFSEES